MDWQDCCFRRIVKSVSPDNNLIASLMKSSERRIESCNRLQTDNVTSESKLSLAYDSLREILEALASENGYKIYNHECYTALLKEILKDSLKGDEFDDLRKIRNSINYYGKEITPEEAEVTIKRLY